MKERRNLIDIYADILKIIQDGARKTHIVYRANLNFTRCKRYMGELHKSGFVKKRSNSPPAWEVTERGHEFLKKHKELKGFFALQRVFKGARVDGQKS